MLWIGAFTMALFLTPGFNAFETPQDLHVEQAVRNGQLGLPTSPTPLYVRGPNGLFYEVHEPLALLLGLPIGYGAFELASWTPFPFKRLYEMGFGVLGCVLFATNFVLGAGLLRDLGVTTTRSDARLLVLLLGSQYLIYAGVPPDVSVAAPFVTAACRTTLLAWRGQTGMWLRASIFAGMAMAAKLTVASVLACVVMLAVVAGARATRLQRVQIVLGATLGCVPGLLILGWWRIKLTGNPFVDAYPAELFQFTPALLVSGLLAALFSINRGLIPLTPTLLLLGYAVRPGGTLRRQPVLAVVALGSLSLAMLRIAPTLGGTGIGGWGNRYYVPWLAVLLTVVAAEWTERRLRWQVCIPLLAGMTVNVAGLLTNYLYREPICGHGPWSIPGATTCALTAVPGNLARAAGFSVPEIIVPNFSAPIPYLSNRIPLWWYATQTIGLPSALAWMLGAALLLGGLLFIRQGLGSSTRPNGNRGSSLPGSPDTVG